MNKNNDELYNLGLKYFKKGKLAKALFYYRKAIRINPKDAEVHCRIGRIYILQDKYQQAIKKFKKAIKIEPKRFEAHGDLGSIYFISGKINKSITELKIAANIESKKAFVYYYLSKCYFDRKNYVLAMKYCEKAVKLGYKFENKFQGSLYAVRGIEYAQKRNYTKAILFFNRALHLENKNAYALKGMAFSDNQETKKAISNLKKAVKYDPIDYVSYYHLGLNHARSGNLKKAISAINRGLKIKPNYKPLKQIEAKVFDHK